VNFPLAWQDAKSSCFLIYFFVFLFAVQLLMSGFSTETTSLKKEKEGKGFVI